MIKQMCYEGQALMPVIEIDFITANQGNSKCQFSGLMAHAGHTYDARG